MPNIELVGFGKRGPALAFEISKHIPPNLKPETVITVHNTEVSDLNFDQSPFVRVCSTKTADFDPIKKALAKTIRGSIFPKLDVEFLRLNAFVILRNRS